MKHVTIKDIAKELNCSISTVSRAFNDKYDIKPETRQQILKIAKELGYKPNPIARKLIQQRSYTVGIIVPEFTHSFFPEVIIGIQDVLIEKGYQVLITQSNESSTNELKNINTMVDNMVDGIIVSQTSENKNKEFYLELIDSGMPVVFFNRVMEDLPASTVLFDDYKWAFFATEHLINQDYKQILHVSGPKNLTLTKNRIRGFDDAHRKHKLPLGEKIISGFSMEDGECLGNQLIQENKIPEAIFAANDHLAIGMMKAFKNNGIIIPDEVAIVGFSESRLAEHVHPTLTSVKQPTYDIGIAAAELLLEQINNTGVFIPQTIVLNGKLNVRESSVTTQNPQGIVYR